VVGNQITGESLLPPDRAFWAIRAAQADREPRRPRPVRRLGAVDDDGALRLGDRAGWREHVIALARLITRNGPCVARAHPRDDLGGRWRIRVAVVADSAPGRSRSFDESGFRPAGQARLGLSRADSQARPCARALGGILSHPRAPCPTRCSRFTTSQIPGSSRRSRPRSPPSGRRRRSFMARIRRWWLAWPIGRQRRAPRSETGGRVARHHQHVESSPFGQPHTTSSSPSGF